MQDFPCSRARQLIGEHIEYNDGTLFGFPRASRFTFVGIPNPGGPLDKAALRFGLVAGSTNSRSNRDAVQPRRKARRIGIGEYDPVCSRIQVYRNHDRHR